MARPYARAPKGQCIYAAVPVNTGKNLTVLAVLSLVGIVEAMTIAGSSDGQVFSPLFRKSASQFDVLVRL